MENSQDQIEQAIGGQPGVSDLQAITDEDLIRIVEISPLPVFAVDRSGNCICSNHAFARFTGYEPGELAGKKLNEFIASQDPASAAEMLFSNSGRYPDTEFIVKNRGSVWGEVTTRPAPGGGGLVFVNDLTERRRKERVFHESEKKRWQSDRIEALGRLAGGIAHDFNNFLAVILLHVDIMNLQLPQDSPIRGRVNEIKDVSNNVAATVRQLLAFGRKQPMTLLPADLNDTIRLVAENLRSKSGEHINVEARLESDLGICFIDPTRIAQVLIILSSNAMEAMPAGGTLRIETSNIVLDRDVLPKIQPNGPYIEILLADTGVGMDATTQEHIFEPFFSTKESDKGAGMSLAMVYGIVKQSKGFIWVESEVDKGTVFRIQFPRVDQSVDSVKPHESESQGHIGIKTVLLVDDEESVRRITAEFLKMAGYRIIEAAGSLEALEIVQAHSRPIHLLLTDYSMPQMNGMELARKIRHIHPETSVLFMSGNIENIIAENGEENINFIGKPFSSTTLTLRVQEILNT